MPRRLYRVGMEDRPGGAAERADLRERLDGPDFVVGSHDGDKSRVGPEGGFSPEEAALAESFGARLLSLGPRILRTETASLAALAAIMVEKGEWER